MTLNGLLVGGSSCVGKTTGCRVLALRHGFVHVETDTSLPFDALLRPLDGPASIWGGAADDLCQRLISAAEAAIPYLTTQARDLSAAGGRWVLEGERVHPALARLLAHAGMARGMFVVETDVARIAQTLTERLPGFRSLPARQRRTVAEVDRLYNLWLIEEAGRNDVSCISSQPWVSLADRMIERVWWTGAPPNQSLDPSADSLFLNLID